MGFHIRTFTMDDYDQVVALWHETGLRVGPSDSRAGITQKLERDPDLFLVAQQEQSERIIGAVMGSYDGRRGWVNHLAVDENHQGQRVGAALMQELETRFLACGCVKVNLLVQQANSRVLGFYQRLGFECDDVIFMQKWLR